MKRSLAEGSNQAHKYAYSYLDAQSYNKSGNYRQQKNKELTFVSNTAKRTVTFSFRNNKNRNRVTIYSLSGKMLFSDFIYHNSFTWNIKNQPNGLYVVEVMTGNGILKKLFQIAL